MNDHAFSRHIQCRPLVDDHETSIQKGLINQVNRIKTYNLTHKPQLFFLQSTTSTTSRTFTRDSPGILVADHLLPSSTYPGSTSHQALELTGRTSLASRQAFIVIFSFAITSFSFSVESTWAESVVFTFRSISLTHPSTPQPNPKCESTIQEPHVRFANLKKGLHR